MFKKLFFYFIFTTFLFPGRFDEAITDMREALSILPEFQPAQQCLEQALYDKKNEEKKHQKSAGVQAEQIKPDSELSSEPKEQNSMQ